MIAVAFRSSDLTTTSVEPAYRQTLERGRIYEQRLMLWAAARLDFETRSVSLDNDDSKLWLSRRGEPATPRHLSSKRSAHPRPSVNRSAPTSIGWRCILASRPQGNYCESAPAMHHPVLEYMDYGGYRCPGLFAASAVRQPDQPSKTGTTTAGLEIAHTHVLYKTVRRPSQVSSLIPISSVRISFDYIYLSTAPLPSVDPSNLYLWSLFSISLWSLFLSLLSNRPPLFHLIRPPHPNTFNIYFFLFTHTINMLFQIWIVSALCAGALAAPTLTYSAGSADKPADVKILTDYFQMLGKKIQAGKNMAVAPVCNLDNAKMPVACEYWIVHMIFAY